MKVNSGNDFQAKSMGSLVATATGTSTATSATTMTDAGASWGTTQFVNSWVQCGNRLGVIQSHTATVLTIDRWYDPTNPGGAAGSTPATTTPYVILPGAMPAAFMALTANNGAPAAGDTALTGEITTAGGGLIRKLCTYAHTAAAASYTLTAVFTANGSDALPVTAAKMGIFGSITANPMVFETLLNATATFTISGDQTTVTETVST
jgi:hypothetical protein